jgi:hypothetical protein
VAALVDVDQHCMSVSKNCQSCFMDQGRVYRINNNGGKGFSGTIGPYSGLDPVFRIDDAGGTNLALLAPKTTDQLWVSPVDVPEGLSLDPSAHGSAIRAAYYSAATILVRLASERLDIDPDELEVSSIFRHEQSGLGRIYINDHLPNGAGYTRWLWEHLPDILADVVTPDGSGSALLASMVSSQHRSRCDQSCYECLRGYRNRPLHGLLDWRLGLDLLRCLASNSYSCGLDGAYPHMEDLHTHLGCCAELFASMFGGEATLSGDGCLPVVRFPHSPDAFVVGHPLWNPAHMPSHLVPSGYPSLLYVDSFNLQCRPSWVRAHLDGAPDVASDDEGSDELRPSTDERFRKCSREELETMLRDRFKATKVRVRVDGTERDVKAMLVSRSGHEELVTVPGVGAEAAIIGFYE